MHWDWNIFWYIITILILSFGLCFQDLNKRTCLIVLATTIIAIKAFLF